jgi:3-dehydroquinate dehydratase/shikimate dehydrogenase
MLALLARKVGAPWVYAALEPGMEAYYEQPTIRDLQEVYHYHKIDRATPFVAVTGFGELQYLTVALFNAVFARLGERIRCLPLEIGSPTLFRKVLDVVKARRAVIDAAHQSAVREVVAEFQPSAVLAQAVDLMTHEDGKWIGSYLFGSAVLAALVETLPADNPKGTRKSEEKALQGRVVLLVGVNQLTPMLAVEVQRAGGTPLHANPSSKRPGPQPRTTFWCAAMPPSCVARS